MKHKNKQAISNIMISLEMGKILYIMSISIKLRPKIKKKKEWCKSFSKKNKKNLPNNRQEWNEKEFKGIIFRGTN